MEAKLLNSFTRTPPLPTTLSLSSHSTITNYRVYSPLHHRTPKFSPISSSSSDETSPASEGASTGPQVTPPPETVEVRFRRRSKRRSRKPNGDDGFAKAAATTATPVKKKKWEDMSVAEKAVELYVGEKGVLFWLNKFAYASIFIVIGGWILFRFVGPSLNLYQLDSPPLSPDSMFKGSS
ncbi:Transmembrane protein [Trema orientale]|uniref:Transmembrane protein n=1 Tax=Trema orientale TaxID=63057 RepID=A0A2P5FP07_TREOI|nr:Transmembrane protein [Trema orientale]